MADEDLSGEDGIEGDSFLSYQTARIGISFAQFLRDNNLEAFGDLESTWTQSQIDEAKAVLEKSPHYDATRDNDADLFLDYVTGKEKLPPPQIPEQILAHIIDYFLRKWAAFEIYCLDTPSVPSTKPDEPPKIRPIYFRKGSRAATAKNGEEEEEEGGETGWMLIETEKSLKTGRIDLFGEYAGLAPFKEALTQLVALAAKKGWYNIGLSGYLPDLGWVLVQEHNIAHQQQVLNVVNYIPEKPSLDRYKILLQDILAQALSKQASLS